MFKNDYILYGKHATFAKNLCESTEKLQGRSKGIGMIRYGIDLIQIAPLIGLAYNKKKPIDKDSNDRFTIYANAVINQQSNLISIYRLILLGDKNSGLDNDALISRAFKDDEDENKTKANLDLFDEYVRGGIEYLYELFTISSITEDDYLDVIKEFYSQFQSIFIDMRREN